MGFRVRDLGFKSGFGWGFTGFCVSAWGAGVKSLGLRAYGLEGSGFTV